MAEVATPCHFLAASVCRGNYSGPKPLFNYKLYIKNWQLVSNFLLKKYKT